jgi:hypothetical protein
MTTTTMDCYGLASTMTDHIVAVMLVVDVVVDGTYQ